MASYVPAWMGPRVAVGGRIYPLLTAYLIPGIKKKKQNFSDSTGDTCMV